MDKPLINFETKRLQVRSIIEADKDDYMELRIADSDIKRLFDRRKELVQEEWENELHSDRDIFMAAFLKGDNTFVASASFQNYQEESVEFGFDVVKEYRNQGIASELVAGMIEIAKSELSARQVVIKTNKENIVSKKIAEKYGGVFVGTEPTCPAQILEQLINLFEESNSIPEEWNQEKQNAQEKIESEKAGVLIYRINI